MFNLNTASDNVLVYGLSSYLWMVFVHVQNIVKRTAPGTEEVVQAIKALKLLEKVRYMLYEELGWALLR